MTGLEEHRPDLTDYYHCMNVIESHMKISPPTDIMLGSKQAERATMAIGKLGDYDTAGTISLCGES